MSEIPEIRQEHLDNMTSGLYPHERDSKPSVRVDWLIRKVKDLGLARPYNSVYNDAITDVLDLLKGEHP